ncbi:MAG: indolepyruvate oxidoreductase subunit beta [Candidatus Bathyarchaeia archaeon]
MKSCDIVVAGVGGQGVLFAAEVLGEAALKEGHDVRVAEIHGMAQRGGSVVCIVRIGENVFSPTVMEGTASVIIGLEPLEALRYIKFACKETIIALNTVPVIPSSTYFSEASYPPIDVILSEISKISRKIFTIDAAEIAQITGVAATQNAAVLGFVSAMGVLPIRHETLEREIADRVPQRYVEANLRAFDLGRRRFTKELT